MTTPARPTFVSTASGVRLCFDGFGDPTDEALLLIQGWGAQMLGWHPEFCQLLADQGFYVVRHDNRDIGLSDKFPAGGYSLRDMARDSAELLDALGLAPAHIVGQSMGGMIAQEITIHHPDVVRSLTLIYTAAHHDHIILNGPVSERQGPTASRTRDEAIAQYVVDESACASDRYPPDVAWLSQLGGQMYDRDNDLGVVERQRAAITTGPSRRPALPAIAAPTAILAGDSDRLIDPAASKELHDLVGNSTLRIYPGMGHSLPRPLWTDIVAEIRDNAKRSIAAGSANFRQ